MITKQRKTNDIIYFRDCKYCGDRFVSNRSNHTPRKLLLAGVIGARPDSVCCSRQCGCLMRANGTPQQRSVRRCAMVVIDMSRRIQGIVRQCRQCGLNRTTSKGRCKQCIDRLSHESLSRIRVAVREWLTRSMKKCRLCNNTARFQKHFCDSCIRQKKRDTHDSNHRQRCRRHGCEYHTGVNLRAIIARDGCNCHYCKKETVRWHGSVLPNTTTLDHVVPISKGGGHTMDNVVIACSDCNTRKSNSETRLI